MKKNIPTVKGWDYCTHEKVRWKKPRKNDPFFGQKWGFFEKKGHFNRDFRAHFVGINGPKSSFWKMGHFNRDFCAHFVGINGDFWSFGQKPLQNPKKADLGPSEDSFLFWSLLALEGWYLERTRLGLTGQGDFRPRARPGNRRLWPPKPPKMAKNGHFGGFWGAILRGPPPPRPPKATSLGAWSGSGREVSWKARKTERGE